MFYRKLTSKIFLSVIINSIIFCKVKMVTYVAINLISDIVHHYLDPRIRLGKE